LLFALFSLVASEPTKWYQQTDLSEFHSNSLISRGCFRGTYGSLSLFTCPLERVFVEPFAEVEADIPLCVVETRAWEKASLIVGNARDVKVLFDNNKYIIVAGVKSSDIYPETCHRGEFYGSALNVYTVAKQAVYPSDFNVLAGKEKQKNDVISDLIALVNATDLSHIDTVLAYSTQQPPYDWVTRNSYSPGSVKAVNWVVNEFKQSTPNVIEHTFRPDMCNNVIAEFPGLNANEIVVVGSHLDSRGPNNTSPTDLAPGADDNGTGSAINLLFAHLIRLQNIGGLFTRTLRLMTFCGEEQGLLGSRNIAQVYKNNSVNVVAMFNADMVGYQPPGQQTTIAFMNGSASPSLTQSCMNIVQTYLPTTAIGRTTACCSDQQAFHEQGYPALGVFETPTSGVVYPDYHRATDTPDKVSFPQVRLFAQAIYACALSAVLPSPP